MLKQTSTHWLGGNKLVYTKDALQKNISIFKTIYEAILKNQKHHPKNDWGFYRITNIAEIDKLSKNPNIDSFLIATSDKEKAFSGILGRSVMLEIEANSIIPYLDLDSILETKENKICIIPFTKIAKLEEIGDNSITSYKMTLEKQELISLSARERESLEKHILENVDLVQEKLNTCIELDYENAIHYENIRKLEQLLAKHNSAMEQQDYEKDTTEEEKQSDLDDIDRINTELTSLKNTVAELFDTKKENLAFISEWKKDVNQYLMAECNEISLRYAKNESINLDEEESFNEFKNLSENLVFASTGDPVLDHTKSEVQENIEMVKALQNNIKNLISKQQNHARIAESIDSNYKALSNAFEMRNYAEELDALLVSIYHLVNSLSSEKDTEKLDEISKINLQVSTLINYLNNPKSAVGKTITRFDEINIIEENELKKEIAETIKNIRCEAELKKLRDDIDIIEDKSNLRKFLGKLTGRNKIDKAMLDQIQIRQTAIRKTFKNKMPLAYNYSIHELIAEIELFIRENEDDELVLEDVAMLRKIENTLKKNFMIMDSKVASIMDQKTGRNLPVVSKKISKKELIEIDTYRFLNRYGYDKSQDSNEPEYQDTVANEIKRIIDYIKSSGIL